MRGVIGRKCLTRIIFVP